LADPEFRVKPCLQFDTSCLTCLAVKASQDYFVSFERAFNQDFLSYLSAQRSCPRKILHLGNFHARLCLIIRNLTFLIQLYVLFALPDAVWLIYCVP
jgi:hypothetical protein